MRTLALVCYSLCWEETVLLGVLCMQTSLKGQMMMKEKYADQPEGADDDERERCNDMQNAWGYSPHRCIFLFIVVCVRALVRTSAHNNTGMCLPMHSSVPLTKAL